jgi:MFS family permease
MDYQIQRGDQKFGPYSLAELQEYVQSGRILLTDLTKSEGMSEWVPVSQILGNIPIPSPVPTVAVPVQEPVPLPPNLHWVIVLAMMILGRLAGLLLILFTWVWSLILANWARRLVNRNTAMVLVAMYPAGFVAGIFAIGAGAAANNQAFTALGFIFIFAGVIAYVVGIFKVRAAMEEYYNSRENIALTLSGAMTFFFSIVYLQYHINRIARWKKTGVLS